MKAITSVIALLLALLAAGIGLLYVGTQQEYDELIKKG